MTHYTYLRCVSSGTGKVAGSLTSRGRAARAPLTAAARCTLRPPAGDPYKTDISQSETDISQSETDISQFETDISQFETAISQFETDISQFEIDISQSETAISQSETDISQF